MPVVEPLMEREGKFATQDRLLMLVKNGMTAARRVGQRRPCCHGTLHRPHGDHIQDEPLRSVVMGVAIGFGMGALAVWLATRNPRA